MSRYIDADILAELVEEEFDGIVAYDVPPDEAVNDFCDIIDSCPTVDVAPVVHGHWENKYERYYIFFGTCSVCKHICQENNICGNCGAIMDESEENNDKT